MKPNEFAFQVFTAPPAALTDFSVLVIADPARYSVGLKEDEHVTRIDCGIFLGSVDDVDMPTKFYFEGKPEDCFLPLPLTDKNTPFQVLPIIIYARNWDGCQHIHWMSEYDHICDGKDWETLCFALHAMPDWSQEALGPAWIGEELTPRTEEPVKMKYFDDWEKEKIEGLRSDFSIKDTDILDEQIIYAAYAYENYSGNAFVLFSKDGQLYEVNGSHCSCYGLENQWEAEKTSWEALKSRHEGLYGISSQATAALRELVEENTGG